MIFSPLRDSRLRYRNVDWPGRCTTALDWRMPELARAYWTESQASMHALNRNPPSTRSPHRQHRYASYVAVCRILLHCHEHCVVRGMVCAGVGSGARRGQSGQSRCHDPAFVLPVLMAVSRLTGRRAETQAKDAHLCASLQNCVSVVARKSNGTQYWRCR